jgi:hypothetical protein
MTGWKPSPNYRGFFSNWQLEQMTDKPTAASTGDTTSEPPYAEGPSISGTWESIKELNSALNREMESKYAYLQILENIAKECGVDTSKSPPEGALAALIAVQRLAAQLREVTAERDAALDDAKVCDAQWHIAVQERMAAESSLSLAMTVVQAGENLAHESAKLIGNKPVAERVGQAIIDFDFAIREMRKSHPDVTNGQAL